MRFAYSNIRVNLAITFSRQENVGQEKHDNTEVTDRFCFAGETSKSQLIYK